MKLHEIAQHGKIVTKIAHTRAPNTKRAKMLKKYLRRQSKKNNPKGTHGGMLPAEAGNFSGLL